MALCANSGNRAAPACARAMLPSFSKSRRFIKYAARAGDACLQWSHAQNGRDKSAKSNKSQVRFVY